MVKMSKEKPDAKKTLIRREYNMAECIIRKTFGIPSDEMLLSFEYNKSNSKITMITLKD